ncbi:hypothetical protein SAMN05444682_105358 [Parapedobacter indicus]|uniref:Uncharacterized protein n=1 Tax=Parapedobacter indicus TaxID=1477437 RepID=A0A1I3L0E3_9SPHI|nr:hypothetical protein CLV26_105358 [Parapedobacter indicus]SFI78137.1 hypothetical protein SAMN05444682_105358 [Parapedobacter indicus]
MSQLPGMTSFRLIFSFRLIKSNYSLRYMNIFTLKNLIASARASAFYITPVLNRQIFSLSNTSRIALLGRNFLLSNPCSVWDCKGKEFFILCKIYFNFF